MQSSAKEDETEEDDEHDLSENIKTDARLPEQRRTRRAISGRGITLATLMSEGIIESGPAVMSIEYLVRSVVNQTNLVKEIGVTLTFFAVHSKISLFNLICVM